MTSIQAEIIGILKHELEYREEGYCQWVLGISVRKLGNSTREIEGVYIARVVVKTNESPYVDGMDIIFKSNRESVTIDPLYYENTPEFQGGEVNDALAWLDKNGKIVYKQLHNPYQLDTYMHRLREIVGEYFFNNLAEYGLGGGKKGLIELYQDLIQETLLEKLRIDGECVDSGKYEIKITVGNNSYKLKAETWNTKDDVIEEIKCKLLVPLIESREMAHE